MGLDLYLKVVASPVSKNAGLFGSAAGASPRLIDSYAVAHAAKPARRANGGEEQSDVKNVDIGSTSSKGTLKDQYE
jgi:hypothetical protein